MTIGAVVPTLDSAIFSRALQSMQLTLSQQGYQLLIASHDYSAAAEAEAVRTLLTRGVDGLMLVGAQRPETTWEMLRTSGIAVVLTWCGSDRFASVVGDNEKAGRLAAQHLIELGHKRIGAVIGALQFNDRQAARSAHELRVAGCARGTPCRRTGEGACRHVKIKCFRADIAECLSKIDAGSR